MGLDLDNLLDRFLINTEPYGKKVKLFKGRSQEILRYGGFIPPLLQPYDFVYIDGSHKAVDVLEDAVLSFRLLKVGGLMMFDDYAWQGGGPTEFDNPKRGVDAFYYAYRNQLESVDVFYQAVFQRVAVQSHVEPESKWARLSLRELVNQLTS